MQVSPDLSYVFNKTSGGNAYQLLPSVIFKAVEFTAYVPEDTFS